MIDFKKIDKRQISYLIRSRGESHDTEKAFIWLFRMVLVSTLLCVNLLTFG